MAKVTISQIAKEAGVSKTAVSFAFNAPTQLAPATVRHIRDIAERLGYTPDPIARSMTTRRTNALGLLLPQDIATALANPFYTQFIRGLGQVCGRAGLTLMLVPPLWGSMMKAIPHATVDGFVVLGLEVDRGEVQLMRRRDKPFVLVDSDAPDDVPSVNIDDRGGAQMAMEYVLAHGHRRIAIVAFESGKAGHITAYTGTLAARLDGYRAALAAYGLTLDDERIQLVEVPSSWEGGQAAFARLWQTPIQPTALVAMSDIIAIGAIDAAKACGLQLPHDLSIVGFDDVPDAQYVSPGLTTVRQPVEAKGILAAEVLVAALQQERDVIHKVLPCELVVRQSVVAYK
ncbi:MAG TPA: LacI family DNA-binding transcriptional regulator [Kouleothrix sp.]|jgi:alanine racemase|nr:LacI family DNA-binding transcriptional regulator [Kouleothrix sp.]